MKLSIEKSYANFEFSLSDGQRVIGLETLGDGRHLTEELVETLDIFFRKNTIDKLGVKNLKIAIGADPNSTSWKVINAFKKALLFDN